MSNLAYMHYYEKEKWKCNVLDSILLLQNFEKTEMIKWELCSEKIVERLKRTSLVSVTVSAELENNEIAD